MWHFSFNQFQSISWFLTFLAKPHTQKKENFPASVYLYTITLNTSSLCAACGRLYNYNLSLSISRTRRTAVFRVSVVSGLFSVSIGCLLTRHDFLLFFCFFVVVQKSNEMYRERVFPKTKMTRRNSRKINQSKGTTYVYENGKEKRHNKLVF